MRSVDMRVLTTAKETALLRDEFTISNGKVDDQNLSFELNEWDDYAIEEAVQIKEQSDEEVEVVAVSIGPTRSEETIRKALAKGADRGVRVWDDALADAELLDVETKSRILAAVANREEPDLVLTGVQSGDDLWGATGVALAYELNYQWAAVVNELTLHREQNKADVNRELEGGVEVVTELDLPAVLTIQTGINEPRYASLRGIRKAQSKPLEVYSLADLDIDSTVNGPLTLLNLSEPETESEAEFFEGDVKEQAIELSELLVDEGMVAYE